MSKKTNPLTGGNDSCSIFPIVDASEAPDFKRKALFEKVFGAMEQLRIEETERCKSRRSKAEYQREYHGHLIGKRRPRGRRKDIGELAFWTLIHYYRETSNIGYNWVF